MSFAELTRSRYSCRSYEDRAIEPEKLSAILEAGRIAPSACNKHPSRVLVCDTDALREKAAKAAKHFAKDDSVFGAPVVLMVCEKGRHSLGAQVRPDGLGRHRHEHRGRPDDDAGRGPWAFHLLGLPFRPARGHR